MGRKSFPTVIPRGSSGWGVGSKQEPRHPGSGLSLFLLSQDLTVTCVNTTLTNVPARPAKTEPNVWTHQMLTCVNAQKVSFGLEWGGRPEEAH